MSTIELCRKLWLCPETFYRLKAKRVKWQLSESKRLTQVAVNISQRLDSTPYAKVAGKL